MGPIQVVVQDGNNLVLEVTPTPNTTIILDRGIAGPPGDGDVDGPASSTDNALARFNGTTGKLIQNSVGILSDAGALTGLTAVDTTSLDATNINALDGTASFSIANTTGVMTINDNKFTLQDNLDNTKKAIFELSGNTTATTRTYTLPNLTGSLATTGTLNQTFSGITTFSGAFTLSGTSSTISLGTSQTSGTMTIGGTAGTGTITIGRSTVAQTLSLADGATTSGTTKTVNIGTGGVSGSITNITIGSSVSGATSNTTVNGGLITGQINIPTNSTDAVLTKDNNLTSWEYTGKSFSVAGQESAAAGMFFSPDGTRMYVIGSSGDDVNQYSLATAWDVTTASFVQVSAAIGEATPTGVFFKPDGTVMYVTGTTNDTIREFSVSTAWDVSTIAFVRDFSFAAQDTAPADIWFKPDGLKLYMVGTTNDQVYEYNLATAWNVSTASFLQSFALTAQDAAPAAVNFTSDGTRMYVLGGSGLDINRYTLSTPWDISTSVFFNNFYVGFQETTPTGMFIDLSNDVAYVVGSSSDAVFQYDTATDGIELNSSSGLFLTGSLYVNKNLVVTDSTRIDGAIRVSGAATLGSISTGNISGNQISTSTSTITLGGTVTTGTTSITVSQSSGAINIGGTAGTGAITLGQSTAAQTLNLATGATANATTKTVNIGTAGVSGSTTNINVGSTVSGAITNFAVQGVTVGRGGGALDFNTVIGTNALGSNTSGINNVAAGQNALSSNTTGNNNVAIGNDTLSGTGTSAGNNTAVGHQALSITNGGFNTAIGQSAGYGITTGSNNVVIGGYTGIAAPISATGSNWIVLSDGAGNVRQSFDPSGNSQMVSGAAVVYCPTPSTITAAATLTNADIQAQIVNTTGATAYTVTLPLGTDLETLIPWSSVNLGYDFYVINSVPANVTMAGNTGVTIVGRALVATNISGQFRIRRTAANTFIVYRIN